MFKKSRAAVAALSVAGLALAAAGAASAETHGADTNNIGPTHCNSSVSGGAPGGRISTTVSGSETRPEGGFFRTYQVETEDVVYQSVDGAWYPTGQVSAVHTAILGPGHVSGGMVTANWLYPKAPHANPRYGVAITTSGTYEIQVVSTLYNQNGIAFDSFAMTSDTCTFEG